MYAEVGSSSSLHSVRRTRLFTLRSADHILDASLWSSAVRGRPRGCKPPEIDHRWAITTSYMCTWWQGTLGQVEERSAFNTKLRVENEARGERRVARRQTVVLAASRHVSLQSLVTSYQQRGNRGHRCIENYRQVTEQSCTPGDDQRIPVRQPHCRHYCHLAHRRDISSLLPSHLGPRRARAQSI